MDEVKSILKQDYDEISGRQRQGEDPLFPKEKQRVSYKGSRIRLILVF